jgi:hypothetical protein
MGFTDEDHCINSKKIASEEALKIGEFSNIDTQTFYRQPYLTVAHKQESVKINLLNLSSG